MADYIKRKDAQDAVMNTEPVYAMCKDGMAEVAYQKTADVISMIDAIPSADVAPVVRCEECKHLVVLNARDLYAHCKRHDIRFEPFGYDTRTNYCSWAERKEND